MDKDAAQDLSEYELEDRLLESLKERDGEATAGDVAADTGLPYDQVEEGLRRMLSQYKSHLDVDDEGRLRYRFDPSFRRRGEEPGRWWHEFKQKAWGAFVWFFKIWTMVMLVGYTIAFVLILIGLSVAALTAGDDEGAGGDFVVLPFYLLARMLETIFYIDLFSRGGFGRRARKMRQRRQVKKPDKAFYQKVFQYLFGPEAENESDPLATERSFTRFVRNRDGRVTAAEWASRSGQSLDEADNALTAGIMRFRGDVDVSDEGALVYRFDRLRETVDDQESAGGDPKPIWKRKVSVPPLTGNPTSTNVWISVFNGFNLLMSSVVLFGVQGLATGVQIGLGVIPFVFSAIFFLLPALRSVRRSFQKKRAQQENERRKALSVVFQSATDGEADPVEESKIPSEYADRFLVDYHGDIDVGEAGETAYVFPDISNQYEAARQARASDSEAVVFGETIFSSDEEEKSLEETEMDEFDERLSRELGGDMTLEDLEESATKSAPAGEYVQAE